MAENENNGAGADGGLAAVELEFVALKENVDDGAVVSESLLTAPKEKVEAIGVEVAALNANVEGVDFAGVDPFPKKLKDGLEVSAGAEPN